jgi:hypothetical protein
LSFQTDDRLVRLAWTILDKPVLGPISDPAALSII